jgi:hypothetical protein
VSFRGEHLQAETEPFLPMPRQQPRIPVWVAALWPHQRPLRRAARWDGVFPIKAGGGFEYQMSPQEMADAAAIIAMNRRGSEPYDLVHAGLLSGDRRRDQALAASYAGVGVTWWLEHIYPGRMSIAHIRDLISLGPPRSG